MLFLVALLLVGTKLMAIEDYTYATGFALMNPVASYSLQTPQHERFDVDLPSSAKIYLRQDVANNAGIEVAYANFVTGKITETDNLNTYTASANMQAILLSAVINGDRHGWYYLYGKLGYSYWYAQLQGEIRDSTGKSVYKEDRTPNGGSVYYGFGVVFQLPWHVSLRAERDYINSWDIDMRSTNLSAEYRF